MKKRSFLLFALFLLTSVLFAQQLSWRFANPRIIRVGGFDNFEFDVQAKASTTGYYYFAGQVILNFNNTTLSTTAGQWTATLAPAFIALNNTAGAAKYGITKTLTGTAPNKVVNIAITGEATAAGTNPPDPLDWVEFNTSYQTVVTVRGRITSNTGLAGVKFIQASMDGQQQYIYDAGGFNDFGVYTIPNIYDGNDFQTAGVGRFYSTTLGWSQVANTADAQWVDWTTAVNTSVWDGTTSVPAGSESKVADLLVYSGATLTIPPTGQLTASGNTTNNGTFTIQSDATGTGSFINTGTTTIGGTGTYNVQKYLTPTDTRWWYIGSPLLSANATAFGTLSAVSGTGTRLLYYNEAGQAYSAVVAGATLNTPLRGYSFRNYGIGTTTVAFTGAALNSGAIGTSSNLTRAAAGSFMGYNLVYNPYPSAINWGSNTTPTSGLTQTNLETTIWYRSAGNFATYNWQGAVGNNGGQQYIPAMQAFWVRVASGTQGGLQLANTTRVHNSQTFYKTAEPNVFRMNVTDGINTDEVVVGFYADAMNTYENYDSEKMFYTDEDVPQAYTLTSDIIQAAINGQPELVPNEERIIPVGFSTPVAGTFTFTATNLNDFDANVSVYLEDLQGTTQDLRQNSSYTFTSGVVNTASRFNIHFINSITGIPAINSDAITIYTSDNTVYINNPVVNGSIEVYDVLGKLIVSKQTEKGLNTLTLDLNTGVYMIKAISGNQIISKRVFIGN